MSESRLARKPLEIPSGVEFKQTGQVINIKGPKGELKHDLHPAIDLKVEDNKISVELKKGQAPFKAMVGTTVVLLKSKIIGVNEGYTRKLELKGVGYRAKAKGNVLDLTLGLSHPVEYKIPEGITIETPSNTEILVKGVSKEKIGQVLADIIKFRPPESYKGKGIRHEGQVIQLKETKKK